VIAAFLFGLFVMVERSQARPMIDLQLMRSGRFIGALLGMFAYAACAQVMMTCCRCTCRTACNCRRSKRGGDAAVCRGDAADAAVGMRLAARLSAAQVFALGLLLVGTGNLPARGRRAGWIWFFALASLVLGAGAGLLNGDTQKNIMACVPRERTGMASG
jgi:hypothetical protein